MSDKGKRIGTRIRNMRKRMGLTLKQLSDSADISLQVLQRIETGSIRPNIEHLEKIAPALGIEIVDLLDESSLIEDIYGYLCSNIDLVLDNTLQPNGKEIVRLRIGAGAAGVQGQPILSDDLRVQIAKDLVDRELLSLIVRARASLSQESLVKLTEDLEERIDFLIYRESRED